MQHEYEYPSFSRRMTGLINSSNFYYFLSCLGLSYFVHTCVFDSIFDRA